MPVEVVKRIDRFLAVRFCFENPEIIGVIKKLGVASSRDMGLFPAPKLSKTELPHNEVLLLRFIINIKLFSASQTSIWILNDRSLYFVVLKFFVSPLYNVILESHLDYSTNDE